MRGPTRQTIRRSQVTVPRLGPITSPLLAVRAAIVQEF
jgi:hypothetical protein